MMSWFNAQLMITSTLLVCGCSSDYVMMTKEGEMIKTRGKPALNVAKRVIIYTDRYGDRKQISSDDISSMVER